MEYIKASRRALQSAFLLITLFLSHAASAGWYVGIDKSTFDYTVQFSNAILDYELENTRLKTGYTSKSGLGFELQVYDTAEDTSGRVTLLDPTDTRSFSTTGKFSSPWAAHITLTSDHEKFGFYGALGYIYIDSDVSVTRLPSGPTTDDNDDLSLHGITVGAYYKITKNVNVGIEYSNYDGEVNYDNLTTNNTANGFLEVDLTNISFGLGYRF